MIIGKLAYNLQAIQCIYIQLLTFSRVVSLFKFITTSSPK